MTSVLVFFAIIAIVTDPLAGADLGGGGWGLGVWGFNPLKTFDVC